MLQPGAVRPHVKTGNSQAHPGVNPLNTLSHRNTGYQPLPKPLGLPPYRYNLADLLGDSGGVQDAEFQSNVANQMAIALPKSKPQFCYHVGDVVYFTGCTTITTLNSTNRMSNTLRPSSPFRAITTAKLTIPASRLLSTAGSTTSCRQLPTWTPFPKTLPAWA
jgi:hypothetical protein